MNKKKKKKETERPPPNLPEGRSWPSGWLPSPLGELEGAEGGWKGLLLGII